jgi:hypothetical protein
MVALAFLCIAPKHHISDQSGPRITGLYSDMRLFAATGDVGGVTIFITHGRDRYYALVQMAEGAPGIPVLVSLEVKDSAVPFTFPADNKYATGLQSFAGFVSTAGLRGNFANGYGVRLRRLECAVARRLAQRGRCTGAVVAWPTSLSRFCCQGG